MSNTTMPHTLQSVYKSCKNMSSRKVINAIEAGNYSVNIGENKMVYVGIGQLLEKSMKASYVCVAPPSFSMINKRIYNDNSVIFTDKDVMTALRWEASVYGRNISVLGGGMAKKVCGNWGLNSFGIDEAIGRNTGAFYSCDPHYELFYKRNQTDSNDGIYNDDILCALNVPVIMANSKQYLRQPFVINYYVASSVNRAEVLRKKPAMVKEIKNILIERIEAILRTIIYNSNDVEEKIVILNPFGCGILGNSASDMADIWRNVLEDKEYKKYFKHIVFICNRLETGVSCDQFKNIYLKGA